MLELPALRTVLELGTLKHIPKEGSINITDLAKAVGSQESLLERMLRLLVGTGFMGQNDDLSYYHTKFSYAYSQEPGPGNWFCFT